MSLYLYTKSTYNITLYLQSFAFTYTYYLVESLRTAFQQAFMTMPCHSVKHLSDYLSGKREASECNRGGFRIPCAFIKPCQQRIGEDTVPELCP